MKILTTYENRLPNTQADAEVVVNTAAALSAVGHEVVLATQGPRLMDKNGSTAAGRIASYFGTPPLTIRPILDDRGFVPRSLLLERAVLHSVQIARLPKSQEAKNADIILTRHLPLALACLAQGHCVAYDHYRPWGEQIRAMRTPLRAMFRHPSFVGVIAHSDWTKRSYERLGLASRKAVVCHNGHVPLLRAQRLTKEVARARLGLPVDSGSPLVVYTGRVDHKKGLDLVLSMARRLPEVEFLWVGCEGHVIEKDARRSPNITLVPWRAGPVVSSYLMAADVILIPPSSAPLYHYGSTVLPLKVFRYLGIGRPIFAGASPDISEVLNADNACLVSPDAPQIAAAALRALLADPARQLRLSAGATRSAMHFSWYKRAKRISCFLERRLSAM